MGTKGYKHKKEKKVNIFFHDSGIDIRFPAKSKPENSSVSQMKKQAARFR